MICPSSDRQILKGCSSPQGIIATEFCWRPRRRNASANGFAKENLQSTSKNSARCDLQQRRAGRSFRLVGDAPSLGSAKFRPGKRRGLSQRSEIYFLSEKI